jgi:signal recognition particle receptor subunit beta
MSCTPFGIEAACTRWQDGAVALIDADARRIDSRVVVFGPAQAGKSAWLHHVHGAMGGAEPVQVSGDDPAAQHELAWIGLGEVRGYTTRFQLTTTAGAPEQRDHRRMLLQHVDGIVFVADAAPGRERDNAASFSELETMLGDWGTPLAGIPLVVFVNKRDLPGAVDVDAVAAPLARHDTPPTVVAGSATTGDGVLDSFKTIAKLVLGALARPE